MQLLWRFYREADAHLRGLPDEVLTVLLLLTALVLIGIALKGSPAIKAMAVGWALLP